VTALPPLETLDLKNLVMALGFLWSIKELLGVICDIIGELTKSSI
jgi:hypothetical protein